MPMNKPHLEFTRVDMNSGWATPPGYPAGIKQKILASDLDESRKMGSRTRLLRFDPGVYTTAPFVHDHWEEVYLVSGDLIVGNDKQGKGGESFEAPTYACRPPGVYHGPFKSDRGCMLYEIHYYDESKKVTAERPCWRRKKVKFSPKPYLPHAALCDGARHAARFPRALPRRSRGARAEDRRLRASRSRRAREPRPTSRPRAGATAGRCRRSTACRSASRTSSRPPTCRPRRARRCSRAGAPSATRASVVGAARGRRGDRRQDRDHRIRRQRAARHAAIRYDLGRTPGGSSSGSAAASPPA